MTQAPWMADRLANWVGQKPIPANLPPTEIKNPTAAPKVPSNVMCLLRRLREECGYSGEVIARQLAERGYPISSSSIRSWIAGTNTPRGGAEAHLRELLAEASDVRFAAGAFVPPEELMTIVGTWSARLNDMPLSTMAKRLGIPRNTLSKWKHGKESPRRIRVMEITSLVDQLAHCADDQGTRP